LLTFSPKTDLHGLAEQIIWTLRLAESSPCAIELCRKVGISGHAFYPCRRRFVGLVGAVLRWLKHLKDQNRKLKQFVAVRTLDKTTPIEVARSAA
jgi:hypothetical protein